MKRIRIRLRPYKKASENYGKIFVKKIFLKNWITFLP